jgi:hypothetical protein
MKKLLYTIGLMMMASVALQPTGLLHAEQFSGKEEDVPFSTARLASKIESAIGLDPAANWTEIFGAKDDKDVGKNLYMVIYKKTQDEPQKQAGKNIAGKFGMPEVDLVRILQGDYTKLVEKKPGMTQEEAMKKIAEIQQLYAEEKDLLQLKADIKAAVEPNEIFANGDINDSGFDLINDLQIIENLLFLKSDPIDVGGTYSGGDEGGAPAEGAPAPGGGTQTAGGGGSAGGTQTSGGAGGTGKTGQPVTGTGTPESGSAGNAGETGGTGSVQTPGQLNPNSCFSQNDLGKALDEFETKKGTDSNFKDNSSTGQTPYSGSGIGGSGSGAPGSSGTGTGGASTSASTSGSNDFMPAKPDTTPPAVAAPPGEWLKEKLCPGFFCLNVKMVTKPATSAYQNADNCIACHAEKINDTLKKVINHTLVPSKAPGNLGESAKCKKAVSTAFGSISMNFYAIAMPVLTPVNDDLVYGMSIEDDWYNYCNAVAFPFSCRKTDPPASPEESTYVIPPSISDMVSKKEISNSTETTSIETLSRNLETGVLGMEAEKASGVDAYQISQNADNSIGLIGPLKVELNLMNYYFANIRDILHSLHEKVDSIPGTQACTVLRDKKECT